jgi:hypothetical protein
MSEIHRVTGHREIDISREHARYILQRSVTIVHENDISRIGARKNPSKVDIRKSIPVKWRNRGSIEPSRNRIGNGTGRFGEYARARIPEETDLVRVTGRREMYFKKIHRTIVVRINRGEKSGGKIRRIRNAAPRLIREKSISRISET